MGKIVSGKFRSITGRGAKRGRGASSDRARRDRILSTGHRGILEGLEARQYLSVSQDANGWTVVSPSADTKIIFVSSSTGSDANNGLTTSTPVKSFTKAQSLLVSGQPDWILLKSGDVFNDYFNNWTASGRNAQEPMLISSYGTGNRPLIDTGTATAGFSTPNNATVHVNYVDLIGVQFYEKNRDPASPTFNTSAAGGTTGFQFYAQGGNVLIEDCTFSYYRNNLDIEGVNGVTGNFTIRRSVSSYSWSNTSHSQGMYCYNISNISVQQSVFDHNGWNALIPVAVQSGFNHDIYFASTCSGVDVENSILAESSYSGIMARAGGTIDNNLFLDDTVACVFGNADAADSDVGGVTGTLIGNAVVGDKALGTTAFGEGFEVGNTRPGAGVIVADNVFTQDTQYAKAAITLTMATSTYNPSQAVGENDVTIENNIINGWYQGIATDSRFVPGGTGLYAFNDVKILNNDFLNAKSNIVKHDGAYAPSQEFWAGNRYYDPGLAQSAWVLLQGNNISFAQWLAQVDMTGTVLSSLPYGDPNRSAATFDATVGGPGTWQDFIQQADQIQINNYNPSYMAAAVVNYVQAGYTLDTTAPTAAAATTTVNASLIGTPVYTFTVTYTDNFFLNPGTLGSANILVTGPNGFNELATLASVTTPTTIAGGYQQTVATYTITPPGGLAWQTGEDGTYSIVLQANQVADKTGNVAADAVIGTFNVDLTPPTAVASAGDITDSQAGAATDSFTITYTDASGIDTTTLNNQQVLVTGPNGYSQYAAIAAETAGTNVAGVPNEVVTYTISPPDAGWSANDDGAYGITVVGGQIADLAGNYFAGGTLATFNTSISGGTVSNTSNTASISGIIFNDANSNGTFDSREVPLVGVTVFIDLAGTGQLAAGDPTAVTDATGTYTFSALPAGTYSIIELPPTGYQAETSATLSIAVSTGQAVTTANFADIVTTSTTSSGGTTTTGGSTTGTGSSTGTGSTTGTVGSSTGSGGTSGGTGSAKGGSTGNGTSNGKATKTGGAGTTTGKSTVGKTTSTGKTTIPPVLVTIIKQVLSKVKSTK